MFEKISAYLNYGIRFCGIEHTTKNGNDAILVSLLKKNKTQVDIEYEGEALTVKAIAETLPKKQHAVLIINNDSVLTRYIESEQKDNLKLVYKAFPNINIDDFYFEVIHQNNNNFNTLCRKKYIDELIEDYKNNHIFITNLSLGNVLIASITRFIDDDVVFTSNAKIALKDKTIESIEKFETTDIAHYNINGLKIVNSGLLSFSGALQRILQINNVQTNYETQKQFLLNDYKQSRFFSQFLKFSGIFILSILLINFLFFNYYFSKVNSLQQTSQINQTTKQKVIALNKSVNKTQKMVDDMLKSNASKSSFYANAIVQSLPNTILLSTLNYQPLEKRIKAEKPVELKNNIIVVSGESNSSDAFSTWISTLETKYWIASTEILDYSDVSKSKSIFSIKINVSNDQ